MTRLVEAVPFLREAVAREGKGHLSHYSFHGGRMYARSPAVLASWPVPHVQGTFGLAADDLEAALGRMTGEPAVSSDGEGRMVLRSGRSRSSVDLVETGEPEFDVSRDDGGWLAAPAGLRAAMRRIAPFVGSTEKADWMRTVLFGVGRVVAMTDRTAIEVSLNGVGPAEGAVLVDACVSYLAKRSTTPDRWMPSASSVCFEWRADDIGTDVAWARCPHASATWPDGIFDRVMEAGGGDAPVPVTNDLRAAVAAVSSLGDGTVTLTPDAVACVSEHGTHREEGLETGVPSEMRFRAEVLRSVLAVATHWNPRADGPCLFVGDGVRGVLVGLRG